MSATGTGGGPAVEVLEREALVPSEIEPRTQPARKPRWPRPPGRPGATTGFPSERAVWTALVVAGTVAALVQAGVGSRAVVNPGGWELVRRFFAAALHPELDPEFLRVTWDATLTTVAYAVVGTACSVVIGLAGGVLVSQAWWGHRSRGTGDALQGGGRRRGGRRRGGWLLARGARAVPRGVHEAVWGLALVNVFGLNPLVAVLAIAIPYGAITAKVYSELLDDTPRRPYDALRAGGAGRLQALLYSLLPQSLPDLVSYGFYRFECAIRAATILGLVGAGGVGFQLLLSFQSLRYEEMWTLILTLVAVCGLADAWSSLVRRRLRNPLSPTGDRVGPRLGRQRDRVLMGTLVAGAALVVISVWHLDIDVSTLWSGRARRLLADLTSAALPPGAAAGTLLRLSVETLAMSFLATTLACAAAMGAAFVAASGRGRRRLAVLSARALLLVCRAIPPPVWALLLLFVLFPGPLPGAMALAVYNFGVLGRLMAEVVENHDPRAASALQAQGAGRARGFLYGVLPLVLPRFVAYGLYRWEVTIRETVVVGLVGAGGLGRLLSEQLAGFDYQGALATALALMALTYLVDLVSASVRRTLR